MTVAPTHRPAMGFAELIAFAAAAMALGALSIDIMLPALGAIADEFPQTTGSDAQRVVYVFTIGCGASQLFFGPAADRFGRKPILLGALAAYGVASALATFANARLVRLFGVRRLLHAALFGVVLVNIAHFALAAATGESLALFMTAQAFTLFALGFIGPNATALALEPMGAMAGAAVANGFAATTGAALAGMAIGALFDGAPSMIAGAFAAAGAAAICVLWVTENGRLFAAPPALADTK